MEPTKNYLVEIIIGDALSVRTSKQFFVSKIVF